MYRKQRKCHESNRLNDSRKNLAKACYLDDLFLVLALPFVWGRQRGRKFGFKIVCVWKIPQNVITMTPKEKSIFYTHLTITYPTTHPWLQTLNSTNLILLPFHEKTKSDSVVTCCNNAFLSQDVSRVDREFTNNTFKRILSNDRRFSEMTATKLRNDGQIA